MRHDILRHLVDLLQKQDLSYETLRQASVTAGLDEDMWEMVFEGLDEVAWELHKSLCANTINALSGVIDDIIGVSNKIKKINEVNFYLIISQPAICKLIKYITMPHKLKMLSKIAWEHSNICWRLCKDQSIDFNFYTKRATLSAAYAASLIYLMSDTNMTHQELYAFFCRRVNNILTVGKVISKFKNI